MTIKNGIMQLNMPLAKHTSWRVGGCASKFAAPNDLSELQMVLSDNPSEEIYLFGLGSNILVRDGGVNGLVIDTKKGLDKIFIQESVNVYAESGVPCAKLARYCARNNLQGAEFFAGIPGTIGGALRMNAGCFGSETWNWVEYVDVISRQGELNKRYPDDYSIEYRSAKTDRQEWFVGAMFKFAKGNKEISLELIKKMLSQRAATQPTGEFSCGSVFKNPPNNYAGKLIEDSNLKGYKIGGAEVSLKHANFIVNNHEATAKDIEDLILFVQQTVKDKYDILLQPEVHIIGKY